MMSELHQKFEFINYLLGLIIALGSGFIELIKGRLTRLLTPLWGMYETTNYNTFHLHMN